MTPDLHKLHPNHRNRARIAKAPQPDIPPPPLGSAHRACASALLMRAGEGFYGRVRVTFARAAQPQQQRSSTSSDTSPRPTAHGSRLTAHGSRLERERSLLLGCISERAEESSLSLLRA